MNAKSMLGAMVMLAASLFLPFEMAGQNQKNEMLKEGYSYPEGSPVFHNGKLHVEGTQMVSECGKPVQLRGMSSHGLAWFPNAYTEESLTALVNDWHIDLFRLAIYTHEWGGYCMNGVNQWKNPEAYNEYIDDLVDICGKLGIYCLIDWHVLNGGSGDPNTTLDYALPFWEYMSEKHKDDKHVLYEICNEPNGMFVDWETVKEYADAVIPVIREHDPNTIVICGSPTWSQDVDLAAEDPLEYDNVMYSLHFYSGTHFEWLRDKADKAISKGLAIFVTEFGTSDASGNGGVYFDECDTWMNWMDERKISWANWSFCDKDESSAALYSGAIAQHDWNDVSESGLYIKRKLGQPKQFESCSDVPVVNPEYIENVEPFAALKYPKESPVAKNGQLHVNGARLENECGFVTPLRGVSVGNMAQYSSCNTASALTSLANDWKSSLYRVSVYTNGDGGYCSTGGAQWKSIYDYNDEVQKLVSNAGNKGLYCIVDWHLTGESSSNPNASLKEAKTFWRNMAQSFVNYKHVIFEICDNVDGADWSAVKSFADTIIPLIRQFDQNKVILCGIPGKDRDLDAVVSDPLKYENVMYTLHFAAGTDGETLRGKAEQAISKGLPLFVSEFTLTTADGGSLQLEEGQRWIEWMNGLGLSWANSAFIDGPELYSSLLQGSCGSKDWTSVSTSGQFIKSKLSEPDDFHACGDGVEDVTLDEELISIYPNPVKDGFSISVPMGMEVKDVRIYDVTGRFVLAGEGEMVDAASLTPGVYFVKVFLNEGVVVSQIVKE